MRSPVLSIGMPVYNGGRWIAEALDSILGQTFRDIELIVSDNASTDDTESIVRRYAAADDRVRYVRQSSNVGPFRNHDDVFHLSRGKYFKWASCSDICLEGFFERCIAILEARPDVVLVYPKTRLLVGEAGLSWDYEDGMQLDDARPSVRFQHFLGKVRLNNPFHGVVRRSALEGTALNAPLHGSDISLMAELALRGKLVELPERLFLRRFTRETSGVPMPRSAARMLDQASNRDRSARARARLHLNRLSIPSRAPISPGEKLRIYAFLVRRIVGMRRTAVRGLFRRLRLFV